MHRRLTLLLGTAVLVAALAGAAHAAHAAHPTTNGIIVFVDASEPLRATGWITTVRPDGTGLHRIGRGSGPAWLPDGSRLVFRSAQGGVGGLFTSRPGGTDLRRVDCVTCTTAGAPSDPGYSDPEPSPDGDVVAVRYIDGIVVTDIATGLDGDSSLSPPRTLVDDCGAGCLSASSPTWSPDGTRIAFIQGDGVGDGNVVTGRVCVVAAAGGTPRCITPDKGQVDTVPDWSPNGRWIAFERYVGCAGTCRSAVFVVRPDGSGLRRVVLDASQPSWSPDGTRLAFVRVGALGSCSGPICHAGISTIRADGTGQRIVTRGAHHVFPDWQPR